MINTNSPVIQLVLFLMKPEVCAFEVVLVSRYKQLDTPTYKVISYLEGPRKSSYMDMYILNSSKHLVKNCTFILKLTNNKCPYFRLELYSSSMGALVISRCPEGQKGVPGPTIQ